MEVETTKTDSTVAPVAAEGGEKPAADETMEPEKKEEAAGEKKEEPENVEMKEEEAKKDDSAGKKEEAAPVKMEKRKKLVNKTVDLSVTSIVLGSLSRDRLAEATGIE